MKRAIVVLLVGLTALVGVAIPARAEAAPPPAGHCSYQGPPYLSYIDCISLGYRWIPPKTEVRGGGQVRCEIPSNYRVVCFNFTPYVVRVRVNIFTTNGLYVRYVRIPYTRKVVYSPAYINRITWRWWWA